MFWVEEGWGIGGDLLFTDGLLQLTQPQSTAHLFLLINVLCGCIIFLTLQIKLY